MAEGLPDLEGLPPDGGSWARCSSSRVLQFSELQNGYKKRKEGANICIVTEGVKLVSLLAQRQFSSSFHFSTLAVQCSWGLSAPARDRLLQSESSTQEIENLGKANFWRRKFFFNDFLACIIGPSLVQALGLRVENKPNNIKEKWKGCCSPRARPRKLQTWAKPTFGGGINDFWPAL